MTKQRHFREWIYFLYSANCFKYMFDGHLCFSTKLRSSTEILREKKLITYILFIYSVKMKYKHLIVKWQNTLISPTLPESVRIWIKAAIRIYSTMRLVLTYTAPAGGIWLLPFSLSIQCLLSLEITNPFFFVDKLTLPHSINSPWLFPSSQAPANLLTPHGIPCSAVSGSSSPLYTMHSGSTSIETWPVRPSP